ncbi:MAG: hypothetical protein Q4B05_00080 [Candidatus Saccharibacteria bacterium]|nr:hypothetical protein [Candidatus Saccharibacteria bacterium]
MAIGERSDWGNQHGTRDGRPGDPNRHTDQGLGTVADFCRENDIPVGLPPRQGRSGECTPGAHTQKTSAQLAREAIEKYTRLVADKQAERQP